LSIVVVWKARAAHGRRPGWLAPLLARAFALRTRTQDDNISDDGDENIPTRWPNTAPANTPVQPWSADSRDAAFDAFFTQHERALYGYLRRMLPTHEAALDVAQEAFFRAWRHFETVRGYDRPQAWLFRVATNLVLDTFRRRQPTGLARIFSERSADIPDDGDASEVIPALTDPFDMERSLAERDLVNRALARLPERQRAAVLLWAAHGLAIAEIAAALETTEVNVRQMLSRGRARFREVYERLQQEG
jgi:RNA polymerase sigma-70 factor (ECF subfamily)